MAEQVENQESQTAVEGAELGTALVLVLTLAIRELDQVDRHSTHIAKVKTKTRCA